VLAAGNLDRLAFAPNGMRTPLARIAAGKGSRADVEEIAKLLAETAGKVEESVLHLGAYHARVRERFGMAASSKLDEVIHGPAGKMMIRGSLTELVEEARKDNADAQHVQAMANQAVSLIEYLNKDLIELHDLILLSGDEK
jgi:hypothetical protein